VFPEGKDTVPQKKYKEAMDTQKIVNFEHQSKILQKWFEVSAYPSSAGLSVFLKDITERKLAAIQLSELNLQLTKNVHDLAMSNKELEDFAYVASHDLQEPLRMVSSFLGLLEKKYIGIIDEKGKQYINFAVDGANRMRQIILDLLDFSKVGKEDYEQESVDLNLIVKEVIFLSQNQVTDTEATINFSKLPTLTAYKTPLRQVIQNLISNSLKYHRTGVPPVINLSAIEFETYWQFEVSDNGIGIEKEYFDKVFLIFKRLHRPGEYSGNGIGLAVCKKIIENFGGRIWLESEVSKGTSFYFTLPKK
jgi:light-regulated signal transduction histidine kinase (bacteriophytochrome)